VERLDSDGGRRLAAGVADLVAPASIRCVGDHLQLDGQFARVLALVGLPPEVTAGWLAPIVSEALPADVSLFVRPQDAGGTAGSLRARHYRLRAVIGADEADDTPTDEDLAAADEQVT
jgi:hypothetical protein